MKPNAFSSARLLLWPLALLLCLAQPAQAQEVAFEKEAVEESWLYHPSKSQQGIRPVSPGASHRSVRHIRKMPALTQRVPITRRTYLLHCVFLFYE
jgi:hypothetical protein